MRTRALTFAIFLLVFVSIASAQDASCAALVQAAFEQLNTTCAAAPGSSACFGSSANATFAGANSPEFGAPGDQVQLSDIQSIQTLPPSLDDNTWGLALLNVHANVPLALSEQGLKYFLVGDVQVDNAVDTANAFTPSASLIVMPLVAANLRGGPSTDASVLANAPVGTELTADGLSADAQWLRVLSGDQVAWISRQVVAAQDGDIDSLPQIGAETRSLMQSFMLKTGNETPTCTDVPPSMLVVQSPQGVNASITVNGVDIRFEGTIVLHVSDENVMQVVVLNGGGSAGGVTIPAGFTLFIPVSADGQPGDATGLRPISNGERSILTPVAEGLSSDLLYTAINVPTQEEVNAVLEQFNTSAGGQVVSGPAASRVDCSRFKPTSPLGGMPLGLSPFYWDGAPGATAYRINVYNADGVQISTVDANASSTTIQIDTGSFGGGSNFAWSVDALVDGQLACSSGRVSVVRDATAQVVSGGDDDDEPVQDVCGGWQGC